MSRDDMSKGYDEERKEVTSDASKDFEENETMERVSGSDEEKKEVTFDESKDFAEKEVAPFGEDFFEDIEKGSLIFINGKRIQTSALKSLQIQYSKNQLVIEINYDEEEQKRWIEIPLEEEREATTRAKMAAATSEDKPSASGVSISKSDGPEVYDLKEDDFVRFCAMSSLRANKKKDDSFVSKLKVKASGKHKVEEVELSTAEYDIKDIVGMSSALNDLAVQEQKIQKDPSVVKVREIIGPKIVFKGTMFTLTEKFKLYKKEGEDEK